MQNDIVKPPQQSASTSDQPMVGQDVVLPSQDAPEEPVSQKNEVADDTAVQQSNPQASSESQPTNDTDVIDPSKAAISADAVQTKRAEQENSGAVSSANNAPRQPKSGNVAAIIVAVLVFILLSSVAIYSQLQT